MKLRGTRLDETDPLAVPLPAGTEVSTRVDREVAGATVAHGALGRVVSRDGDRVRVHIVGVGEVDYARSEVTPRKAGQLRYAQRRHEAWEALLPCRVIETVVGSRAWGLADETSDTDVRGVFVLPFAWTNGLVEAPVDLVSEDGSAVYWEVGKALRQGIRADPNTLEMLFVSAATARDEMGAWVLEARNAVASADIYGTFGRYALSQIKRLRQSLRLAEHRSAMLAWLRADATLTLDAAAARLAVETEVSEDRAKQYIKQLYGSLFDQGLVAERDFASLARLAREGAGELALPRDLRPKNAYNLLRLIATATAWLRTGTAEFEVAEPLRSELLAIKHGQVALDDVLIRADELTGELEHARQSTALPPRADVARIDAVLRRVRTETARRHLEGAPGPWGIDAPTPPGATWND